MKKIIFSILFFSGIFSCLPLSALGAVMEVTVSITNLRIPERAAMAGFADRPNTEFSINDA